MECENLFTGWEDVQLSEQGRNEAITSGKKLKENKIEIDVAYTSLLTRALETTQYLLVNLIKNGFLFIKVGV